MEFENPLHKLKEIDEALALKRQENQFLFYKPYPKQLEFHAAGEYRERLLIAGNQLGKTFSAGNEYAYHATGCYPDWWPGYKFPKPIIGWAAGVSLEGVRDGLQKILLGQIGQEGTGTIPKSRILQIARKVNNSVDFIRVRWGSEQGSKESFISIKSYDQGREKFQAASINLGWCDEEPPEDVYSELITRTNATKGKIFITFTPLKGVTSVVRRFLFDKNEDRHVTQMTIDDAPHIEESEKQKIINSYLPHERDARTKGVPVLGSGLVYPIEQSLITVSPFPIPNYWKRNYALDFGWEHPFAAVEICHDPDNDVIYVTKAFRISHRTPKEQVMVLKDWGDCVWQWPHDGYGKEKGTGEELKKQYQKAGLRMYPSHATLKGGGISVEAGIMEIFTRMQTGKFKVFANLSEWFMECNLYFREEGIIVKVNDDLMDATRYAVVTLRRARNWAPINPFKRNNFEAQVAEGDGEVVL